MPKVYLLRKINPDDIIRRVRENEEIAIEKGVPSWITFSNVKLFELSRDCPTDEARLYEISVIALRSSSNVAKLSCQKDFSFGKKLINFAVSDLSDVRISDEASSGLRISLQSHELGKR